MILNADVLHEQEATSFAGSALTAFIPRQGSQVWVNIPWTKSGDDGDLMKTGYGLPGYVELVEELSDTSIAAALALFGADP
ncbi:hypothetical protein [Burkholderia ubonensis]|uniref:hypothetical protein n=1 Tax=Burkholderia ubonensis TaxID=101571 RepID=UPI0007538272|nr:hypothetical protein [Burkholderia ubonensis]KWK76863.1 hypothetical protein WM15_28400 [Burkholderia ubonensis]